MINKGGMFVAFCFDSSVLEDFRIDVYNTTIEELVCEIEDNENELTEDYLNSNEFRKLAMNYIDQNVEFYYNSLLEDNDADIMLYIDQQDGCRECGLDDFRDLINPEIILQRIVEALMDDTE